MANRKGSRFGADKLTDISKVEVIFGEIIDAKRGRNNGFSLNTRLQKPPHYGYMVGLGNDFTTANTPTSDIRYKVAGRFKEAKEHDLYMGGWVHNGEVIVENSQWIKGYDAAMACARMNKQVAIWDLEEDCEVIVK